jgi:hypothetical protein
MHNVAGSNVHELGFIIIEIAVSLPSICTCFAMKASKIDTPHYVITARKERRYKNLHLYMRIYGPNTPAELEASDSSTNIRK